MHADNMHINSAYNILSLVRQETDKVGVALSFGKDSLTVLDLCCKVFSKVEAFYLYRVAGLRVVKKWRDWVKRRYNVTVRMYPHWDLSRCYKYAVLQPHWDECRNVPSLKMRDIEEYFRGETGVEWIAYGWRRNDSISRALIFKKIRGYDPRSRRFFPIWNWKRSQVLQYIAENKIMRPESLGRRDMGGLDFHPEALRFLRDNYPDDWQKWLRDFPFSGVQLVEVEPRARRAEKRR